MLDEEDVIRKKIMKATTDSDSTIKYDPINKPVKCLQVIEVKHNANNITESFYQHTMNNARRNSLNPF